MTTTHPVRSWLPAYLLLAVIWGNSFFFIKVALESLTPAGVVFGRIALAMVTMLVISALLRVALPARRYWKPLFIAAFPMSAGGWLLFSFSEQYISSALAGIINGVTPLTTLAAILVAFPEEKPTRQRVVGLVLGFLGVVVVVGVWQGLGASTWLGIAACLLAVIGYGISYPYTRRHLATGRPDAVPPIALATGLMVMGTLQSIPFVLVSGFSHAPITPQVVWVMLTLGIIGGGIAYVLNFRVITRSDATTASTVTFAITVVAVISGAVFLSEDITWNQPVGALIVIVGASIAQGLLRLPRFARP
ncbi:MAG TPA: multidrug DMT transporter permease [Actinobacteria bacterium]|jgi:drug/metabolite transporter (DMT)-like permease|nr:multidrug DMT transporter permease [Actinomycetota bacterium]